VAFFAQRAGVKAIVFIHPNNNRDSILIPRGSLADSIRIPCFSVRQSLGEKMMIMLPSLVGIRKPDVMPEDAQGLVRQNNANTIGVSQNSTKGDAFDGAVNTQQPPVNSSPLTASVTTETTTQSANGATIRLSPNPSDGLVFLEYKYPKPTDMRITVRNSQSQIVLERTLKGIQLGTETLNLTQQASGGYTVQVWRGENVDNFQIVVVK
jgi:hypothetical protein